MVSVTPIAGSHVAIGSTPARPQGSRRTTGSLWSPAVPDDRQTAKLRPERVFTSAPPDRREGRTSAVRPCSAEVCLALVSVVRRARTAEGGAASQMVAAARRRPGKAWLAAEGRAARTMKRSRWGRARPTRHEFRSCRRARTTEPRGRKRATEQRRQVRLNAFEHFDVGCETLGGLRRGNNEGKNFQPAR